MTKKIKHITVENAEKSSLKTSEISDAKKPVREDLETEAEQLIKTTTIKPVKTTEPEKPKRGRPPKKAKATWDKAKYSDNVIAKTINDLVRTILNKTITKEDQIKPEEIELGEATVYALDYYLEDIPLTHPVMVLLFASISLGIIVINKKKKKSTAPIEEQEYIEQAKERGEQA